MDKPTGDTGNNSPGEHDEFLEKKSIAAAIVLFHPDVSSLRQSISSLEPQVAQIVLIDNTPNQTSSPDLDALVQDHSHKVTLINNGANLGIASALNQALLFAHAKGFSWILTMDQDSVAPGNLISCYLSAFDSFTPRQKARTAIICPALHDVNMGALYTKEGFVRRCITSGSLTRVDACILIGGFDDYLFIDCVDYDICDRLYESDWLIYRTHDVVMEHEFGTGRLRHLLFLPIHIENYPPFRHYYQVRNGIYCAYKRTGRYRLKLLATLAWHSFRVLVYETDKGDKLRALPKGAADALKKISSMKTTAAVDEDGPSRFLRFRSHSRSFVWWHSLSKRRDRRR